jgi:hypothetical protein
MSTASATYTARQTDALRALLGRMVSPIDQAYRTAAFLEVGASTLGSLISLGLVQRIEQQSSLRGGERYAYRLTNRGYNVARKVTR